MTDGEIEQHDHEPDDHGLQGKQLHDDGRGLSQEDRRLVDGRKDQALEGPVLSFGLIGLPKGKDGGEQDRQPQQAGGGLSKEGSSGPEGEPEGDEQRPGEREDGPGHVASSDLDPQVFLRDGQRLPQRAHRAALRSSGSNRPPSMYRDRVAAEPRVGSWVATMTVPPRARVARISSSTRSLAGSSRPA